MCVCVSVLVVAAIEDNHNRPVTIVFMSCAAVAVAAGFQIAMQTAACQHRM